MAYKDTIWPLNNTAWTMWVHLQTISFNKYTVSLGFASVNSANQSLKTVHISNPQLGICGCESRLHALLCAFYKRDLRYWYLREVLKPILSICWGTTAVKSYRGAGAPKSPHCSRTVKNQAEWKSDTTELKKPHPSRLVGGAETWRHWAGWSHTHVWWINIREGYLENEESQPHNRPPAQGSSVGKINPISPSGTKTSGDWVGRRNFWSPKQCLLKGLFEDLLRFTPSELQHWGSSLKGTSGIQGGAGVSGIKVKGGDSFLPGRKAGRGHFPFLNPPHTETQS